MKKIKFKYLFMVAIAAFLSSCGSNKNIAYFQDIEKYGQNFKSADYYKYEPVIKSNDQLRITVSAPALYQEKVAQFNLPVSSYLTPGETNLTSTPSLPTYHVDKEGIINFPVLGKLKLAGMTKQEAMNYIEKRIADYIREKVIVNLEVASFNISVHGEVFKPGPVKLTNERISVLAALGAAGGITVYGDKTNVLLVRDNNGTIEHCKFDLTQSDIFNSPYFYLHQNDMLFVESTKSRMQDSEYGQADNYKLNRFSVILSAISSITTIVALLIVNNKK
ncbi:MAG: polysaccharide biosynthesis/export family protein [Tannerella sp.]|jgi:polysaccharide export outer membrane protein|nr:polysaccharide biosynthesis/export family protein [Tannerella sp.]